jgi:rubrerythrin
MERYSVGEVIEMALQTERLGYQFYTEMGERFRDDHGLKDLFDTLALKEKSHEAVFTKLKDRAGDAKVENSEEVGNYMRAMVESAFFLGSEKSLPELEHVKSVEEAVDFALGFEKETLLFFIGLRSMFEEAAAVDEVINEERSHIAWLSKFREKL